MSDQINTNGKKYLTTKTVTRIGVLAAAATLLMALKFRVVFVAPSFYKLDFSEVVVLIGAFAMGPLAGVIIEAIKVLLNFVIDGTVTAGIGELSNFVIGCALVLPAALIYKRNKTKKGAVIGLSVGVVAMVIVGSLMNYFVLIPAYVSIAGVPLDAIIGMGAKINPAIVDLKTLIIFATAPFNLIKGGAAALITLLIYKSLSRLLHK